ncbi:MAG: sensor histidine kinase, partial [Pseudomonadales bacterium]|nr:sensor histidine kinase [Pseudomonadales bacterium]
ALNTLLKNLLSNANKYTPIGGQIRIRVQATREGAHLKVEDSGPGIPKALEERIFERFYRAAHTSDESISGCGLGLTIVKNIVELQGANIKLERSSFDSGSAFIIDFKAVRPNAAN